MQVDHVPAHHRYIARLPEGDTVLAYRVTATGMWDIVSTYVPPAARGRGIGSALVHAALTQARHEGRAVIPTCWFVDVWLAEHPGFRDLVNTGSSRSA
jgi:uncharacterized protein